MSANCSSISFLLTWIVYFCGFRQLMFYRNSNTIINVLVDGSPDQWHCIAIVKQQKNWRRKKASSPKQTWHTDEDNDLMKMWNKTENENEKNMFEMNVKIVETFIIHKRK